MAARFPLIANSSANQIQELASGDDMDLTGNSITGAGIITATKFAGNEITSVGGVDATGGMKAAGIVSFTNATDSTSSTTGAVIISGGVGIAKSLFVGNNVTVGGTITYEDVTNVDSVGIITAQTGVIITAGRGLQVTAGGLNVAAGVGTFKGILDADAEVTAAGGVDIAGGLKVGAASTLQAITATTGTFSGNVDIADTLYHTGDSNTKIRFPSNDTITATTSGTERVHIDSSGNVGINTDSQRALFDVRGSVTLGGGQLAEKVDISGTSLNSDTTINLDDGMVHYRSTGVGGAGVKCSITSSVGLNTAMDTGDCIAVTIISVASNSSHYVNALMIDHADVTESWIGGSAPSEGGGSGYDIYAFNIIKTGSSAYVVIGNHSMTSG